MVLPEVSLLPVPRFKPCYRIIFCDIVDIQPIRIYHLPSISRAVYYIVIILRPL